MPLRELLMGSSSKLKLSFFMFFLNLIVFSIFSKILVYHGYAAGIVSFTFQNILDNKSSINYGQAIIGVLLLIIERNMVNSIKFCIGSSFSAGSSLARLARVSVWQSCGKPLTKFSHG